MKTLTLTLMLIGVTAAGGCIVETRHPGEVATIEVGHTHSDFCGHHYYDGRWYYTYHHRHGPGCGHIYRRGIWVWVG
jgi:hypothetical protein